MCFMCASRVSTCECSVCGTVVSRYLMYLASRFVWLRVYESLLTYVAHMDLIGDPLQGTCHAHASKILITRIRKIFYVGYRRIFS